MNRKPRYLFALGFASLMIAAVPSFARAELSESSRTSVSIGPTSSGPRVSKGTAGFDQSGIEAVATATGSTSGASLQPRAGPTFTYIPVPDNIVTSPTAGEPTLVRSALACPAGQTGYFLYDPNGVFAGLVCVPDFAIGLPALTPSLERRLAEEASSRQPWPSLAVRVSPDIGVTGLDSWFWLSPGSAAMPPASAAAGSLVVTVRATLVDVLWEFGDGARIDSGLDLGQPYPARSLIRHVYQMDTYQRPTGYPVLATLRFGVWYSVNAGPWRFLGTKAKGYSLPYRVYQIQPEGVPVQKP